MVDPKVREWVEKRKRSRIAFYPTAVAKATGLPLKAVYEQLKELVDEGLLIIEYEMRCPNYGCFHTVEDNICEFCGEDLTEWPEEEVKFPYFRFVREEAADTFDEAVMEALKKKALTQNKLMEAVKARV